MKILITENQLRKVQFKYLDYLFEGIHEVKSKNHPDSRFWKKNDKVVLELEEYGRIWVLYSIWNNISDMFLLTYDETQQLIKEWVEPHLKLERIKPFAHYENNYYLVEQRLK